MHTSKYYFSFSRDLVFRTDPDLTTYSEMPDPDPFQRPHFLVLNQTGVVTDGLLKGIMSPVEYFFGRPIKLYQYFLDMRKWFLNF
jgi:hypothetical protein